MAKAPSTDFQLLLRYYLGEAFMKSQFLRLSQYRTLSSARKAKDVFDNAPAMEGTCVKKVVC